MTNILNVRGTNGSGKTTLVAKFCGPERQITTYKDKHGKEWPGIVHYDEDSKTVVIGKYVSGQCGGCDKIKTQDGVQHIILAALRQYNPAALLFEGLLVSGLYGRYKEFDEALTAQGHRYAWAFLTPSLEECMRRVQARSGRTYEAEGLQRLEDNVRKKRDAVIQVRKKALGDGRSVWDLNTESEGTALAQARLWLNTGDIGDL